MNYYEKYLKYKNKYLELKNLHGGMLRAGPQPHLQQGVFNQLPPPIPKPQLIVPQPQLQPTIKQEVPNCDNMYKELYEYAYDLKLDDLNRLLKKCPTIDINHIFEEKNNENDYMRDGFNRLEGTLSCNKLSRDGWISCHTRISFLKWNQLKNKIKMNKKTKANKFHQLNNLNNK
jgi:hypothetical protein